MLLGIRRHWRGEQDMGMGGQGDRQCRVTPSPQEGLQRQLSILPDSMPWPGYLVPTTWWAVLSIFPPYWILGIAFFISFLGLMQQFTTNLILNNKNLFSPGSGGQEPQTKVPTGHLKVSEGLREECSLASSSFWGLPATLGVPCGSVPLICACLHVAFFPGCLTTGPLYCYMAFPCGHQSLDNGSLKSVGPHLNSSRSANSWFPNKVTFASARG